MLSSSSMLATRITPSCRNTASTTASSPATEPVWASAATWPAGLEPVLSTTTGLPAVAACPAARVNRSGSLISSTNRQMTRVCSSSAR